VCLARTARGVSQSRKYWDVRGAATPEAHESASPTALEQTNYHETQIPTKLILVLFRVS